MDRDQGKGGDGKEKGWGVDLGEGGQIGIAALKKIVGGVEVDGEIEEIGGVDID